MRYLDTSVVVAATTKELWSEFVFGWLDRQRPGSLQISWWVQTECAAALSQKVRRGEITPEERGQAAAAFERATAKSFIVATLVEADFAVAARLASRHSNGLRAGDALHLAVSKRLGSQLCTLDHGLDNAGRSLGLSTLFVGDDKPPY